MKKTIVTIAAAMAIVSCMPVGAQNLKLKGIGHNNRYDDGEQMRSTYVAWNSEQGKAVFIVDNGIYAMTYDAQGSPKTSRDFILANPGTEDLGVSVSETGSFSATLSATTIAAGSEVTLTVTMPDATSSSQVTITPDAGSGIDPFIINVSGTEALISEARGAYLLGAGRLSRKRRRYFWKRRACSSMRARSSK